MAVSGLAPRQRRARWASNAALLTAGALLLALSAGPPGAAAPPVDAIPSGPSVAERLEEIRDRVQSAVEYPPLARERGWEGVAHVRFGIERSGAPVGVKVARSSGHALLDRAAERSVDRAAPLPWVYGRVEVPVRFRLDEEP